MRRARSSATALRTLCASVVAVLMVSGCFDRGSSAPGASASPVVQTPSPGPQASPPPAPRKPQPLYPSKAYAMLPLGPPPRIPYVYGGQTLVVGHHAPQALPAPLESVTALVREPGGWLVAGHTGGDGRSPGMSTEGFAAVTRLDDALRPVWTRFGADQFAVSGTDASSTYFTTPDRPEPPGRLVLLAREGKVRRTWTIPFSQVAVPVGITSRAVVYNLTGMTGNPGGAWTTGYGAGMTTRHRLPLYFAEAATGGLVAGQLRKGCQVVLQGKTELWRRCDGFKLAAFSPDGRYVAAWHTETGGEFESAYVLDARTGRRVTDTAAGSPISFHGMPEGAIAWEDDRHVLIAFDDGLSDDWEVLRLGLDGSLERTTGAFRERHGESAFVFAAGP